MNYRYGKAIFTSVLGFAVILAGQAAQAEDANLDIAVQTMSFKMPAMPDLPPGIHIPGLDALTKPHRTLQVMLLSPGIAPQDATATLDIPEGLRVGKTAVLELNRPKAPNSQPDPTEELGDTKVEMYWGCGDTVEAQQPKTVTMNSDMRQMLHQLNPSGKMDLNGTTATWPTLKRGTHSDIKSDASAVGDYSLHTTYVGNATFQISADQDFLDPVEITTKGGDDNLEGAITVSWKPVAHALGYQVMASGLKMDESGKHQTTVFWTSSKSNLFDSSSSDANDLNLARRNGMILSPDDTTCTVPPGIFKGAMGAVIMVQAIGPRRVVDGAPRVKVSTSSMASVMLGMPGMDR